MLRVVRRPYLDLAGVRRVVAVSPIMLVAGAVHAFGQSERAPPRNSTAVACQVIAGEEIQNSPTVALALRGRAMGLQLQETSGQAGAGSRVALRGVNTLAFTSPMVFVDGIKMVHAPEAGQAVGILDQLNPSDVLLIEIFRGPAATTMYGTDAAGGVIRIYTKHGNPSAELTSDPRARCLP